MKKIVGMAAIPDREMALRSSIESLYDQVDIIHLALNEFKQVPGFIKNLSKIQPIIVDNGLGDANKYLNIDNYNNDSYYYFSCDDDLIYPPNYIDTYVSKINETSCLITSHGSTLPKNEIGSYFKDRTLISHYNKINDLDKKVDIPGTGVSGFNTSYLKLRFKDFLNANMADIFVGIACKLQNVNCIAISHPSGWIKDAEYDSNNTLYKKHRLNDSIQTKHLNKITWK